MFAAGRLRLPLSCSRAAAQPVRAAALLSRSPRPSSACAFATAAPAAPVEPVAAAAKSTPLPSFFTPADGDAKPFFITTPIFYVNASPHIGHLHSVVLADVFARFARLRHPHREVLFCTGTDEHGLKIQQAAAKGGMTEHEFCDEVSQRFRDLSERANVSHTDFIRTSEPRHYRAVEAFWAKLVASGGVYKGSHSGWYSVSDECFYASTQVEETNGKMVASETGSEVSWQEEENWKFRLSMFQSQLQSWLENPESVHPPMYHQSILKQTAEMQDLSISRPSSRVKWGVPVPGDDSQTIYVWVDALINYLTVTGYPDRHTAWPADMHVVGKDIIRFHALHWPALLSAAGEAMPKRVLAHAHWTMGRAKMSKSRGNVADPLAAMDKYGVDGVRWYLMRAGGALAEDADYSETELAAAYTRLQAQIGNLVGRISSATVLKNVGDRLPVGDAGAEAWRDAELEAALVGLRDTFEARFETYDLTRAASLLLDAVVEANRVLTLREPWAHAGPGATAAVAYAHDTLRLVGILAQPIMPSKAVELLDRLGVPATERGWAHAAWDPAAFGRRDVAELKERVRAGAARFKGQPPLFPKVVEEGEQGGQKVKEKKKDKSKKDKSKKDKKD